MKVGVIGGGQLAWMMADAASKLGVELVIQTPHADDPAVAIATHTILAPIADAQATAKLAQRCDVITFENEFVDLEGLAPLAAQGVPFYPQLDTLAPLLDKYQQRCYLRDLGLPVPRFALPDGATPPPSLSAFPIVIKARRHGYDGQGTFIVRTEAEWEAVTQRLGQTPFLVEEFIPFERELAIMAARSVDGAIATYPLVETRQVEQVCRWVQVTDDWPPLVIEQAEAIAHTLLHHLQMVGMVGIELFLKSDGTVLVNEIAPRTHNSGHFTLDACLTSQFEQQLRAVCGLSLGETSLTAAGAVMVNLLGHDQLAGYDQEKRQQLSRLPHTHVYWYGKTSLRPGRKLGHVTTLLDVTDPQQRRSQAIQAIQAIEAIWYDQHSEQG